MAKYLRDDNPLYQLRNLLSITISTHSYPGVWTRRESSSSIYPSALIEPHHTFLQGKVKKVREIRA